MTISLTADKLPNMHSTDFRGIPVVIQWPKGSTRVGERKDTGEPFKIEMKADYGYIPATVDIDDDDHVDVYIGPNKNSDYAYILEQMQNGEFDEYKIMLGYDSLEEAEQSYLDHLPEDMLGDITEVPFGYLFDTYKKVEDEGREDEGKVHDERAEKHVEKRADEDERMSVIDAFIKLYKHEVDFYDEVARQVAEKLEDALQEAGIRAIVTFRAKKPRKLKMKLLKRDQKRQYQSFRDIYDDIVDLAGVRVALYLPADRDAVGEIIEKVFAPVRAPKMFPRDRGPNDGMGYIATHYLVQLRPEGLHKDELRYADTNVEIQVASVLMHAWAEVTHDLIYKPEKGALTPQEMKLIDDLNVIVQQGENVLERLQESVETRNNGAELRFELAAALTKLAQRLEEQSKGIALKRLTAGDVVSIADRAIKADPQKQMTDYLKNLGWRHAGFNDWSHPNKLQETVQLFHDGWIHRSWDKMVASGDTLDQLQAHLAQMGLGESYHAKESHYATYIRTKLALWKAHKADELDDRLREAFERAQYKKPEAPGDESRFLHKALAKLHPGVKDVRDLTPEQYHKVLALAQDLKNQDRPGENPQL